MEKDNSLLCEKRKASIPIWRGKVKKKFLAKHAHLLCRKDPAVGVLITCNTGMDANALGQARSLLDALFAEFYPNASAQWPERVRKRELEIDHEFLSSDSETEKDSINSSLHRTKLSDRKFQAYDTGSPGYLFIRFRNNACPSDFIHKTVQKLCSLDSKKDVGDLKRKLRYCQRWLPVEHCCPANLVDLRKASTEFVVPKLKQLAPTRSAPLKLAVIANVLSNAKFTKTQAVMAVADQIPDSSSYCINLKDPDYTIMISVIKSVATFCILPRYRENLKYNLNSLLEARGKALSL